jgi:hypothetical protein
MRRRKLRCFVKNLLSRPVLPTGVSKPDFPAIKLDSNSAFGKAKVTLGTTGRLFVARRPFPEQGRKAHPAWVHKKRPRRVGTGVIAN